MATRPMVVTGEGKVVGQPDMAVVKCRVEGFDKNSLDVAASHQQKKMEMLRGVLSSKNLSVPDKDVTTGQYYSGEKEEYKKGERVVMGQQVVQYLLIKVPVKKTPLLLEALKKVATVDGIDMEISNVSDLKKKAALNAIDDAKLKALEYSDAMGVELDGVIAFQEGRISGGVRRNSGMKMMAQSVGPESALPDLPVGEEEISAQVTVTYQLKKR